MVDNSDREYGFPGRKPSKWSMSGVVFEYFDDPEQAIQRSYQVSE